MWGDYAIQRLTGEAAKWAQLMWLASERVDWDDFKVKMAQPYIPADYLNKLKMAFANLTWDPKKLLTEFNETFKSLRLRLQIINEEKASAGLDATIYDRYITKIEQAANKEKASGPVCLVYSAYVQWTGLQSSNTTLLKAMDFCSKMDDIHNRHTSISLEGKAATPTTNRPLTTSEGGDAMYVYTTDGRYGGRN